MIIFATISGFIAGAMLGFKAGPWQWRVLGWLGILLSLIFSITLLNWYGALHTPHQAFAAGLGALLLGNAIGTPFGAAFNT